ncbi:MAG: polysaccharide biosynthesis/export family protein, partial [Pyrinomonadaceae bacterium]
MNKRSFTKTLARAALLLTTSGVLLTTVWAQQGALVSTPTPKPTSAQAAPNASPTPSDQTTAKGTANGDAGNAPKTTSSSSDNRYRIGPGDVLDIRVIRAPELSREAVRVDQSGMIRIPMIDEDVRAACLTEGELSKEIVRRYKVYKNDPKVDVFVKEYQSQPVALIGAVNEPGQFKLQRKVTLLELLTYVKGPTEKAGRSINVIHAGTRSICEDERPGADPGEELQTGLVAY